MSGGNLAKFHLGALDRVRGSYSLSEIPGVAVSLTELG